MKRTINTPERKEKRAAIAQHLESDDVPVALVPIPKVTAAEGSKEWALHMLGIVGSGELVTAKGGRYTRESLYALAVTPAEVPGRGEFE